MPSTPNLGLTKPNIGDTGWGVSWNDNADILDSAASSADIRPSSPDAMDDEFDGDTLDTKWVWTNQRSASAAVANGQLILTAADASDNANGWNLLLQSLPPSGSWTFAAKLWMQGPFANYASCGLCVLDSVTGHRCNFGPFAKSSARGPGVTDPQCGGLEVQEWNDLTSYADDVYADHSGSIRAPLYYKISNDETSLTFSISMDGLNYSVVLVQTLAAFIAAPNKIGFSTWPSFVDGNPLQVPTFDLMVEWFRRLA